MHVVGSPAVVVSESRKSTARNFEDLKEDNEKDAIIATDRHNCHCHLSMPSMILLRIFQSPLMTTCCSKRILLSGVEPTI